MPTSEAYDDLAQRLVRVEDALVRLGDALGQGSGSGRSASPKRTSPVLVGGSVLYGECVHKDGTQYCLIRRDEDETLYVEIKKEGQKQDVLIPLEEIRHLLGAS
jgi:hypothetical protein